MRFRERWISFLHRTATGTKRTRSLLTPIGVSVFVGFTALFVVAANLVDSLLGLPSLLPDSVKLPLSIPVMAAGLAVTTWSAFHFLRVKGTPVPFNPPPTLVTTGPYRFSRNPMLAGVFLFMFGLGFAFNSVSLVFVFVPLFILVNVWELKEIEEPELEKRLGSEYLDYKRRTPIFIPRVSQGEQSRRALRRGPRC